MSRIFFILVAVVALALTVLLFAPYVIPVAAYKGRIETAASAAVGRDVTIGDNLRFQIIPRTSFHVETLSLANAPGFEGDALMRVREADIGVKLLPLLSGIVEVDRFILMQPDINLVRAQNGAVNWNLGAGGEAQGASGGEAVRDVRLGDVRIVDGRARFADNAAGKTYLAEDIDFDIVLKSLAEPFETRGSMIFQGEPATVDLVLTTLAGMRNAAPSNLKIDLLIGETAAGADLSVELADELRYRGPINLNAPDLSAFAALAGTEIADAPGFDRLSLSGEVDGGAGALRLSEAKIGFDDIAAEGALTLDWSGQRPKAGGVLSTEKLDLRPYLPPPATSETGFPAWSEEKFDFASLRNIDADFDISTNAIFLNDLEFGESRLLVRIDHGRMTADIPELAVYGGQGSGQLVVNARSTTPSFTGNFDLASVNAQPFSLDVLKHDKLLGLGALNFNFSAAGASQAAIMSSLDGEGGFDIADGAFKGVNLAAIARAVGALTESVNPATLQNAVAVAMGPREETDFSEFLSDFSITDGRVNAPTIRLSGPFVTMTGGGAVNLPAQSLDLRLSPRASTSMDGAGGQTIAVPLRLGGTFSQPQLTIDAESLLRGGAQRLLQDIVGGARRESSDAEQESADNAAKEDESLEETLIREGLGAIFGSPRRTGEDEAPPPPEDE